MSTRVYMRRELTPKPSPTLLRPGPAAVRQRMSLPLDTITTVPSSVEETLRTPGQPLAPWTRSTVEWLGFDFSRVRIHSDANAAVSAQAIQAEAYTVGPHIVFGSGSYASHTARGHALLMHELAHVMQRPTSAPMPTGPLRIGAPDLPQEHQAERTSHAARGAAAPSMQGGATTLASNVVARAVPQTTAAQGESEATRVAAPGAHIRTDDVRTRLQTLRELRTGSSPNLSETPGILHEAAQWLSTLVEDRNLFQRFASRPCAREQGAFVAHQALRSVMALASDLRLYLRGAARPPAAGSGAAPGHRRLPPSHAPSYQAAQPRWGVPHLRSQQNPDARFGAPADHCAVPYKRGRRGVLPRPRPRSAPRHQRYRCRAPAHRGAAAPRGSARARPSVPAPPSPKRSRASRTSLTAYCVSKRPERPLLRLRYHPLPCPPQTAAPGRWMHPGTFGPTPSVTIVAGWS
jgi:hypothetical protein